MVQSVKSLTFKEMKELEIRKSAFVIVTTLNKKEMTKILLTGLLRCARNDDGISLKRHRHCEEERRSNPEILNRINKLKMKMTENLYSKFVVDKSALKSFKLLNY